MHPDWNTLTESFDADIAVLVLESNVAFSRYIQPVCLLSSSSNLAAADSGVVVGYGKSEDETKIHENIPKMLSSQIHSNPHCFLDNRALARISSGRTFCGGPGRGIGVCRGDSGGGLYVTDGNAYYLRGIVSSSLIGGQYGCDVDTYSVFTDILKFINWINGILLY
jgi:secreted trypsin-like serine protease